MIYKRDTETHWSGTFEIKQFAIRATSPENIFITDTLASLRVVPQDASTQNGAYIVTDTLQKTAIALAMKSCENVRILVIVDITDNTQRQWTAMKIDGHTVMTFNQIATETGPASTEDRAWISVNNGNRVVKTI